MSVITFVGFYFEYYILRAPVQGCEKTNVFCHYRSVAKCCAAPNELWLNNRGAQTGGSLIDSQAAEENSLQTSVKGPFLSFFFFSGSGGDQSDREAETKSVKQSECCGELAVTKPQLEETTGKRAAISERQPQQFSHSNTHKYTV